MRYYKDSVVEALEAVRRTEQASLIPKLLAEHPIYKLFISPGKIEYVCKVTDTVFYTVEFVRYDDGRWFQNILAYEEPIGCPDTMHVPLCKCPSMEEWYDKSENVAITMEFHDPIWYKEVTE